MDAPKLPGSIDEEEVVVVDFGGGGSAGKSPSGKSPNQLQVPGLNEAPPKKKGWGQEYESQGSAPDGDSMRRSMSDPTAGQHPSMRFIKPVSRRRASKRAASKPKHDPHEIIEVLSQKQITHLGLKSLVVCIIFVAMLSMPAILGQKETETFITSASNLRPSSIEVSKKNNGLIESAITAGHCFVEADAGDEEYHLKAYLVSDTTILAEGKSIHIEGVKDSSTSSSSSSSSSSSHRRLNSGGSEGMEGGEKVSEEFDLSEFDLHEDHVKVVLQTNCPSMVAVVAEFAAVGVIGQAQEWIALIMLIFVLLLILTEIIHRTLAAFLGAAGVLFLLGLEHRLPEISTIIGWMDHGTLALLWGMMIIVALLSRTGVFEWAAVRVFQASGANMWKLFWMLMIFDCILSAFLDNVTTMLLLSPVVISLCKAIDVQPKPMLISLALFGNIGGTATMIGDPPNIIIGNALSDYITFMDFLVILGPGVLIMFPFALAFARWYYGNEYFSTDISCDIDKLKANYPIREPRLLIKASAVLFACIVMFFLHPVTHLDPAYIACFGACLLLLLCGHHEFEYALEKVEWDSLLFFAGLFVFTEGVAELGLLGEIADLISKLIKSIPKDARQMSANIILHWVSACVSAFVDNIPFTTTMIPVIKRMTENVEGLKLEPLAWSLAFGADLGGMGTLIGASDNVVMAGIAQEAGYHVSFMEFFKIGWPMMCICASISCVYMIILESAGALG